MGIQLKGGNGGNKNRTNNMNSNAFGSGELEETPQMKELRMKREAEVAAAKEALAIQSFMFFSSFLVSITTANVAILSPLIYQFLLCTHVSIDMLIPT